MEKGIAAVSLAVAAMVMLVAVVPAFDSPHLPETADECDGVVPLVVVLAIVFIAGGTAGLLIGKYLNEDHTPSDIPDTDQQNRENESRALYEKLLTGVNMTKSGMGIDAQTYLFTETYWQRQAEIIAAGQWAPDGNLDPTAIMDGTEMRALTDNLLYNWQYLADKSFWHTRDVRALWQETSSLNTMTASWEWLGNTLTSTGQIRTDFCVGATGDGVVYIDPTHPPENHGELNSTLYVMGGAALLQPLEFPDVTYSFDQGRHDISDMPKGYYRYSGAEIMAGPLSPATAMDAAPLVGGAAILSGDHFRFVYPDGEALTVKESIGAHGTAYSVDFTISGGDSVRKIDISPMVYNYAELVRNVSAAAGKAHSAAVAAWSVFDSAGEASVYVSPTLLVPDLADRDVSDGERRMIAVLAMAQQAAWLADHPEAMDVSQLKMSAESFDAVFHGTIYDREGTAVATNAVFTAYNYVRDATLTTGGITEWGQPGIANVLAEGVAMGDWDGETDPATMRSIAMVDGFTMEIDAIRHRGEDVATLTMQVKKMDRILDDRFPDHTPMPDPPKPDPLVNTVRIALVSIGAVLLLLGAATRRPWALVGGLAFFAFGLFAAPNIVGLWRALTDIRIPRLPPW